MFCIIILGVAFAGYFIVAKNPVDRCSRMYKDLREDRHDIHVPKIFDH